MSTLTSIAPTLTPSGGNDTIQINTALATNSTVYLSTGHFLAYGRLMFNIGNVFLGQGIGTLLDYGPNYVGDIECTDVSNIEIGNMTIEGTLYYSALGITASNGNQSDFYIHDITMQGPLDGGSCFVVNAQGYTISNVVFSRCQSIGTTNEGFKLQGTGAIGSIIKNIIFYRCSANNTDLSGNAIWSVGYSCCDAGVTVQDEYFIACTGNAAWESIFHFEGTPIKQGVVFLDNNASYAGQKPTTYNNGDGTYGPQYGSGYLLASFYAGSGNDIVFNNNGAVGNHNTIADVWAPNGKISEQTSLYNFISGRTAVATRGTQNGCVYLDIFNSAVNTHDLIVYSTNSTSTNVPSQSLTLSDGTTYVVPAFTDFYIILAITGSTGFVHGTSHTASFEITVQPANESCQVQLWLAVSATASFSSETAKSSLISFISGTNVPVSVPITMPAAGIYYVYIDLYMLGIKIESFTGANPITVT
jgi:hypothetical protein